MINNTWKAHHFWVFHKKPELTSVFFFFFFFLSDYTAGHRIWQAGMWLTQHFFLSLAACKWRFSAVQNFALVREY